MKETFLATAFLLYIPSVVRVYIVHTYSQEQEKLSYRVYIVTSSAEDAAGVHVYKRFFLKQNNCVIFIVRSRGVRRLRDPCC